MVDFVKLNARSHQRRAAEISARVREMRKDIIRWGWCMSFHELVYIKLRLITEDRAAAAHYKRARELMGVE